jgi:hypothetical protein
MALAAAGIMVLTLLVIIGAVVLGVLVLGLLAAGVSVLLAGVAVAQNDPGTDR